MLSIGETDRQTTTRPIPGRLPHTVRPQSISIDLWCVEYIYYSAPDRGAEYCDDRVCLSVCVCLSVREHISGTTRPIFTKFLCMLPMSVARSYSGGVATRYVLPVLWMTSYLRISQGSSAWHSPHAALDLAINGA